MSDALRTDRDARGVVTITLNRPEKHNPFGDALIAELTALFRELDGDDRVRAVVLTGAGKSFSSGADLNWMRAMAGYTEAENLADARRLGDMLETFDTLGKPTIARINGHAFGGAVGLISCCDIAIAADHVKFALSEVRLGLAPAVISPYVIAAIGPRQARRWFQTGAAFDASRALKIGLVHEAVPLAELDDHVTQEVDALLACGPQAQRACKRLVRSWMNSSDHAALREHTAEVIAALRVSSEGREGLAAFFDKRDAGWKHS